MNQKDQWGAEYTPRPGYYIRECGDGNCEILHYHVLNGYPQMDISFISHDEIRDKAFDYGADDMFSDYVPEGVESCFQGQNDGFEWYWDILASNIEDPEEIWIPSKEWYKKQLLLNVAGNFEDYCGNTADTTLEDAQELFRKLIRENIFETMEDKLDDVNGAYSFYEIIKRVRIANVAVARDIRGWFEDQIRTKFHQTLMQYQGQLYNVFANALAEDAALMAEDERFDSCVSYGDYIFNNEIKSSKGTTNDGSYASALRKLRRNEQYLESQYDGHVISVMCILDSAAGSLEVKHVDASNRDVLVHENKDLSGFHYLYVRGRYAWQWLFGVEGPYDIAGMCLDDWDWEEAERDINRRVNNCMGAFSSQCQKYGLDPSSKHSLLKLAQVL